MPRATYQPTSRALQDDDVIRLRAIARRWVERSHGGPQDIAQQYRNRAIILILLSTGITLHELTALNVGHYTAAPAPMLIAGALQRQIPIDDLETRAALSRWLVLRKIAFNPPELITFPLFTSRRLERIHTSTVQQLLDQMRNESGIDFDMFNIRHTFILSKLKQNYSPAMISTMMGRASREIVKLLVSQSQPG